MAMKKQEEYFTHWTHVEGGITFNRRLHRIEIQANDGRLYIIEGDRLPYYIQTCTGAGHKGVHVAQILLDPNRKTRQLAVRQSDPWPNGRDVLMIVTGLMLFISLRYALRLIGLA